MTTISKTDKQIDAVRKIGQNTYTLLEGGSRSGKTFIALYVIIVRALKSKSDHLVVRFRFSHAKQAICYQTMPKVLEAMGLIGLVHLNKSDWFYTLPNGSTIWVGGLDDKERSEKILGNEYATIFLNEASQISYDSYEIVSTRLNPPKGVAGRIMIDYNPPSIHHWGYKMFHQRIFPDGRSLPEGDFAVVKMNPRDNLANISETYIQTLSMLSEAKRKRFLDGDYSLDSGKLWRRAWIRYHEGVPDLIRIVIGVDPSGSVDGDEIGIVIAGHYKTETGESKFLVLDDFSLHGTPEEWAGEVAAAYNKYAADLIVAEKNYGGDMVESVIKGAQKRLNVKLITSSRGKVLRAEPISAMYERAEVEHRIPFLELEDEMCIYDPEVSASPNRLDAAVFALTELGDSALTFTGPISHNKRNRVTSNYRKRQF